MREIFLRSYIAILLTLFITASIVAGSVHVYNQYRFGELAQQILAGPLNIIAERYQNTPEAQQQLYITQLQFGMVPSLVFEPSDQTDSFTLDYSWMREYAKATLVQNGFKFEIEAQGLAQLTNNLISLIYIDIRNTNPEFQTLRIEQLQQALHFPLVERPVTDLSLSNAQKFQLARNKVLLVPDPESSGAKTLAIAVKEDNRNTATGLAMIYGPIPQFVALPVPLALAVLVVFVLAIALGTWPSLLPLQNRLQRMADSVNKIDHGDMNHRLPVEKNDALDEMASAINELSNRLIGALDAQRTLVHAVSHELKTPLARMQFRLSSIEEQVTDKVYNGLERDLQSLSQLVNELLEFGKEHPTQAPLSPETIELHALIKSVWQEQNFADRAVEFTNKIKKPCYVEVDPNLARKLLSNLFSNAIRFCEQQVMVEFDEQNMQLRVHDDGPGIPEKQRTQVLQPFFRLDPSRQRGTGGHGLGLSIAHRIAAWHQGDLWFESSTLGGALAIWHIPDDVRLSSC